MSLRFKIIACEVIERVVIDQQRAEVKYGQ